MADDPLRFRFEYGEAGVVLQQLDAPRLSAHGGFMLNASHVKHLVVPDRFMEFSRTLATEPVEQLGLLRGIRRGDAFVVCDWRLLYQGNEVAIDFDSPRTLRPRPTEEWAEEFLFRGMRERIPDFATVMFHNHPVPDYVHNPRYIYSPITVSPETVAYRRQVLERLNLDLSTAAVTSRFNELGVTPSLAGLYAEYQRGVSPGDIDFTIGSHHLVIAGTVSERMPAHHLNFFAIDQLAQKGDRRSIVLANSLKGDAAAVFERLLDDFVTARADVWAPFEASYRPPEWDELLAYAGGVLTTADEVDFVNLLRRG